MTIKAVRMFDGGLISQPFAFGGEEGREAFDEQLYYRSSLQNWVIDTGDEVILADTGFVGDFDLPPKKAGTPLYMGDKVQTYPEGLAALKANKLSTATQDMAAARVTLDRIRAFIQARPTVYLSTHCPEGYESLELKRVMYL